MQSRRRYIGAFACGAALLLAPGAAGLAAAQGRCAAPEPGSSRAPLISPPVIYRVTGMGRLPFFSAPDVGCPMPGVFVIAQDEVIVYATTDDGWASVMYIRGAQPIGWVRSARLKSTGATVGPKT